MARVTVVTPAYNEADIIGNVIASVASQCYDDIEHIIVNDGSSDETANVVRQWSAVCSRLQLVEMDEHVGPSAARNLGVQHGSGEFILFVDADDLLSPRYVDTCLAVLEERHNTSFAYTDEWYFMKRHGNVKYIMRQMYDWSPHMLRQFNTMSVTALMRRYMFLEVGGFRDMPVAEDYDFWLNICGQGYSGVRVPEALFYHQIRGRSRWTDRSHDALKTADTMMRQAHGDIAYSGIRRALASREDVIREAGMALLALLGSTTIGELRLADGDILVPMTYDCEK